MKIGITTYFNIKNYGSALQAFAMKSFLEKNGHQAEFLNVKESQPLDKYLHKLHVASVTAAKCLVYPEARRTQQEIMRLKRETSSVISEKSQKAFDVFGENCLPSVTVGRRKLKKAAHTDAYGAFICGSDQIWSPLSPHLSGFKFLNFAPKQKRIAYAPSFGVSKMPSYNRTFVKKMLMGMEDISVREYDGANMIEALTGRKAPVLLDPTMLLAGDQWRVLYRQQVSDLKSENYVLCYFFDEPGSDVIEKITKFASDNNCKIKVLFPSNEGFLKNGAQCVDAGPMEFLQLVDGAQYVFTNSFHGCVFSVLFQKPFIAFGRKHSETVKQTSRIETLLQQVGASQSFYSQDADFQFPDTECFDDSVEAMRQVSSQYLLNCLQKRMME